MIYSLFQKVQNALNISKEFSGNKLADLQSLQKGLMPQRELENGLPKTNSGDHIRRIKESFIRSKEEQLKYEKPYQTTGEWVPIVEKVRANYIEALKQSSHDEFQSLIANFFRNSGSAGLNTHESYESAVQLNSRGKKDFILKILRDLKVWQELTGSENYEVLKSLSAGNPWGYYVKDTLVLPNACRHHYSAWRANNLLRDINVPILAEIGGGYGGFGYFLKRDNSDIKYINFDLPEVLMISQYYLLNAFPDKKILLFGEKNKPLSCDSIRDHDIILLPNFLISELEDRTVDLLFNCNSLSEMNEITVNEYFRHINRVTKKYFFHINSDVSLLRGGNHYEIPSSKFPISNDFKLLAKNHSSFDMLVDGRYKEFLYERSGSNGGIRAGIPST